VCNAYNLPLSCTVVLKSGNLNFLEPSGPVQAFNGNDYYYNFFPKSRAGYEVMLKNEVEPDKSQKTT